MLAVDEIAANIVTHGYDETGRQGDIDPRTSVLDYINGGIIPPTSSRRTA